VDKELAQTKEEEEAADHGDFKSAFCKRVKIKDQRTRGVARLHGARDRSKFGAPVFEPEVLRKQMYCIEETTCDIFGTFWRPHSVSAPEELCPITPLGGKVIFDSGPGITCKLWQESTPTFLLRDHHCLADSVCNFTNYLHFSCLENNF